MILLDIFLGLFPFLSFSCREIAPIFAQTIVPRKSEMEIPTSSHSELPEKGYLSRGFYRHLVREPQRIDSVRGWIHSIGDLDMFIRRASNV
jgi:hypothetical protein